ncbi:MAG: metallophosphoesterase [Terracidiphilus sp.]|nr:metallophosphoesterase [Terracidiphilus sp.]
MRLRVWPVFGVVAIELFLCLFHWFLYHTWIAFWGVPAPGALLVLRAVLTALAFSFVAASLLSFRSAGAFATWLYRVAAVWLGFLNYLFWTACMSWVAWYAVAAALPVAQACQLRPWICTVLSLAGVAVSVWGMVNARWIRIRRITIPLAGLPEQWRGRKAVLVSDVHLGHVLGAAFSRRIVRLISSMKPDIVLIPGDLFDGGKVDAAAMLAPFRELKPPFGIFFSSGNHDEFGDMKSYTRELESVGIQVLADEAASVDGITILGIPYAASIYPQRMRAALQALQPEMEKVSILLNHVPTRLPLAEEAGVALQLSGHTHAGQVAPFTWLTRSIFGVYTHGLSRYGALTVYTSTGAGSWGPPMRVGSQPEIVEITFEQKEREDQFPG